MPYSASWRWMQTSCSQLRRDWPDNRSEQLKCKEYVMLAACPFYSTGGERVRSNTGEWGDNSLNKKSMAPLHKWEKPGSLTSFLPLCFHSELTRHKPANRLCREADVLAPVQVCIKTAVSLLERPLLVPEDSEIREMGLTYVPSHSQGFTQNRECGGKKREGKGEKNLLT